LRLSQFPFLADENIHPGVVRFLRDHGCDVLDVKEAGLAGTSDRVLLDHARPDHRVILTHDADFGALAIVQGEQVRGIVYLRPGHIHPSFTVDTLSALFRLELELVAPFLLVAHRSGSKLRVRLRHLP
jgi:predicted nuclease of predicted toxin-antitoxin system